MAQTFSQRRHVLITGASGALGRALALKHAACGDQLTLHGRREEVLAEVAAACRTQGGEVTTRAVDLLDRAATDAWIAELRAAPPDRLIANAGLNAHPQPNELFEPEDASEAILEVNLRATMRLVRGLAPGMAARGSGEIVFVSSLAAWHGLSSAPTYSATKAAIKAYAEALTEQLRPHGVAVTLAMPGYFDSPMGRAMPGPHPGMQTPERAAHLILRASDRRRPMVAFPQPLAMGCRWLGFAPRWISHRILRLLGFAPH